MKKETASYKLQRFSVNVFRTKNVILLQCLLILCISVLVQSLDDRPINQQSVAHVSVIFSLFAIYKIFWPPSEN